MSNSFLKEKLRIINFSLVKRSEFIDVGRPKKDSKRSWRTKRMGGFVLLIALLVSSVMLTAGLAVSRIIVRQIYMASVQRDSQVALFAADAGIECAKYWKDVLRIASVYGNTNLGNEIKCNGQILHKVGLGGAPLLVEDFSDTGDTSNTFWFNVGSGINLSCAVVTIYPIGVKEILSNGYNVSCDNNGTPSGGRIVERSLERSRTFLAQ